MEHQTGGLSLHLGRGSEVVFARGGVELARITIDEVTARGVRVGLSGRDAAVLALGIEADLGVCRATLTQAGGGLGGRSARVLFRAPLDVEIIRGKLWREGVRTMSGRARAKA